MFRLNALIMTGALILVETSATFILQVLLKWLHIKVKVISTQLNVTKSFLSFVLLM